MSKYVVFLLKSILDSFEKEDLHSLLLNVRRSLEDFTTYTFNQKELKQIVKSLEFDLEDNGLKCRWKDDMFIEIVKIENKFQYSRDLFKIWG